MCVCFLGACAAAAPSARGPRTYPLPSPPNPGPNEAWVVSPQRAEELFTHEELTIISSKDAGAGVTGALRFELAAKRDGSRFKAKWKPVPWRLDSWNNSPRHELAAYEVQKLFLDAEDYLVPTSGMRCIPVDSYGTVSERASANLDDSKCVLGALSLWLENVKVDEPLYDEERFPNDPNYAYHLANFNTLTVLIDHKDGRSSNFLVSKNEEDRRTYSVDNGISFDAWIWNWFVPNWNQFRVPAISRKAVDRLRQVKAEDIERLGVLAELRLGGDGIYRTVTPGPNLGPTQGVRTAPGVVQFGLNEDEVDDIAEQIEEILELVDSGELPTF
jgi:hypothetical protein